MKLSKDLNLFGAMNDFLVGLSYIYGGLYYPVMIMSLKGKQLFQDPST